jgi:hypothetical protein
MVTDLGRRSMKLKLGTMIITEIKLFSHAQNFSKKQCEILYAPNNLKIWIHAQIYNYDYLYGLGK